MHFFIYFLTKKLKGSVNTFYPSLNIKFSRFPVYRTGLRLVKELFSKSFKVSQ
jgi:hypothetical protein